MKTFYNLLEKYLLSQIETLTSENQSILQYDLFFKKIITYNTFINQFIYNLHSFSFESVTRNIIIKGNEDKDAKITELMDILQSLSIEIKLTSKEEIGNIKEIYYKQYEQLFNFIKAKNYANKLSLELFVLFDENNNEFIECLTEEPIDLYLNTKIEYLLNYIKFQLSHFNNRNNSALFLQNPQSTKLYLISDKSYNLINKNISYLIFLDFILIIQHEHFDYEERISTKDAFHYIMKIIFSLHSNLLNLIISNIPLRNLLKSFIDEFKSFDFQTKPFIDSINQMMISKQNEISLFISSNNKQIVYETIYKEFIFKLHLFCNQSLHPILNISMKYNNPYYSSFFELNFNFVNIPGLINKYLNENILLGVNKHFLGNNELKSEMKKLFAERIKYRIFNQKNTLLFAIITFIEQLNKGLNPWKGNYENYNKIKYSIDFNPELVQGITTEYINVNSLDNFFDIEKINIDLIPKEQNPDNDNINKASPQKELKEVKIMIQLTCCQMKYMRSEKDFVESLKFDGSNSIEYNKYFEKWISHAYLNELLLKLKAKLKSM